MPRKLKTPLARQGIAPAGKGIVSEVRSRGSGIASLALMAIASLALLGAQSCASGDKGPAYSTTQFVEMPPGDRSTQARIMAIKRAEDLARAQIVRYVRDLEFPDDREFPDGSTLGDAIITDPFIRAKVYDTVRTARVTDQTISEEGVVTVTVRLEMAPLLDIIAGYHPR